MVTNRDSNNLDHAEKNPNLLRRLAPLTFLIRFRAFRDPLRGELPRVQIFMNDGPNPLTWDAQLLSYWFAEIRRSSKISSSIWSIISGEVTVLCRPGRGASQVEKSTRLNWVTKFLTVAYDGACSPNVSVRMAWISFGALPCRKKNWWQPASPCCSNRARHLTCFLLASVTRKYLQFGTWTDPSFQRHYRFRPMTSGSRSGLSVPPRKISKIANFKYIKISFKYFNNSIFLHKTLT